MLDLTDITMALGERIAISLGTACMLGIFMAHLLWGPKRQIERRGPYPRWVMGSVVLGLFLIIAGGSSVVISAAAGWYWPGAWSAAALLAGLVLFLIGVRAAEKIACPRN